MKKNAFLLIALALSSTQPQWAHDASTATAASASPEIRIKFNKDPNDSNIVLSVEISGSNEKDIAKIVDLITSIIDQLDTTSAAQLSWTAQNPTAALVITGVVSAGLTAAIAAAVIHMRSE